MMPVCDPYHVQIGRQSESASRIRKAFEEIVYALVVRRRDRRQALYVDSRFFGRVGNFVRHANFYLMANYPAPPLPLFISLSHSGR